MKQAADTCFCLRFKSSNRVSEQLDLPASVLSQALKGLQRAVHLSAMVNQGHKIKTKLKIPKDVERHVHLFCQVSEDGGYCQPTIVAERTNPNLVVDEAKGAVRILREVMKAVSKNNADRFSILVTDPAFQHHMIISLRMMLGRTIENCIFDIEDRDGTLLLDGASAIEALKSFEVSNAESEGPVARSEVIGRVEKIDFGKQILFFRVINDGKLLEFEYDDKFENTFIENRDDLIEIRGDIEICNTENKIKITNIHEVLRYEGEKYKSSSSVP